MAGRFTVKSLSELAALNSAGRDQLTIKLWRRVLRRSRAIKTMPWDC